jgi:hypothetical protein
MDDDGWQSRLYRARSWIQRAAASRRGDSLDARFIFYWIAFNAMYGQAEYLTEDHQGEDNRIHDFLGKMVRLDSDRRHIRTVFGRIETEAGALLANEFLWKEYWTGGFSSALRDFIRRATDDIQAVRADVRPVGWLLPRVFDRLYLLRVQLFHGCSKDGSSANRDSLKPAVDFLARLVPLFWAIMKRAGNDEDWGLLSYPALGRPGHPQPTRAEMQA